MEVAIFIIGVLVLICCSPTMGAYTHSLNNLGLTAIPQGIPPNTTSLTLDTNSLTSISAGDLAGLPSLITISLRTNNFNHLPYLCDVGPTLVAVTLDVNPIVTVDRAWLVCLTALNGFSALGTSIATLPDFSGMALGYIAIHNQLTSLPPAHMANMPNVRTVLIPAVGFSTTPDLSPWTQLVSVFLHENKFTSFSAALLGNLPKLKLLTINGNLLTEFPDLCSYGSHLTNLTINQNPINSIDVSRIICLTALQNLDMSLLDVTGHLQFSVSASIDTILMSGNQMSTMSKFPGLTMLTVFNVNDCPNLLLENDYFLGVNWDSIIELHMKSIGNTALPDLSELGSLHKLDISDTAIVSLDVTMFAKLGSLVVLNAKNSLTPFLPSTCPMAPSSLTVDVTGSTDIRLCQPRNAWLKTLKEEGATVLVTDQTCMPDGRLWSSMTTQELIATNLQEILPAMRASKAMKTIPGYFCAFPLHSQVSGLGLMACTKRCLATPGCYSFNYRKSPDRSCMLVAPPVDPNFNFQPANQNEWRFYEIKTAATLNQNHWTNFESRNGNGLLWFKKE